MPRRPRGQDAIHHVDSEAGVLDNLLGGAHSHHVTRFVGGKMLERGLDHFARAYPRLAHAEPADGITGKADLDSPLGRFFSQFEIHAALNDSEQGLSRVPSTQYRVVSLRILLSAHHSSLRMLGTRYWVLTTAPRHFLLMLFKIFLTAFRPAQSQFHRSLGARLIGGILRALIERHYDVGAEADLRLHRALWTEKVRRTVEMRTKRHAFLGHFAKLAQAENLEAAGISKDRARPCHETMQSSHLPDGFRSGT